MTAAAAQPAMFDEDLRNFGSLVGLVLVFVVLFTNQRWTASASVTSETSLRARYQALALNVALLLVTAGLFATGMPFVLKALEDPQWLRVSGAIRDAFTLVWLLLLGLLGWQIVLAQRSAVAVLRKYPWWVDRQDQRDEQRKLRRNPRQAARDGGGGGGSNGE